jgi:hypothetical protein
MMDALSQLTQSIAWMRELNKHVTTGGDQEGRSAANPDE